MYTHAHTHRQPYKKYIRKSIDIGDCKQENPGAINIVLKATESKRVGAGQRGSEREGERGRTEREREKLTERE